MKKYIFLALLTLGVSSCQLVDVLDQKPEFEADLDGAITTPASVYFPAYSNTLAFNALAASLEACESFFQSGAFSIAISS